MIINGIPESIDGDFFTEFLAALGLDPFERPIINLTFKANGLYVELESLNAKGIPRTEDTRGDIVIQKIFIPFVWKSA